MDTKGSKRKHRKKTKTSKNNGKPEVFVLPPDLLKKLGISIGNINNDQEVPYDVAPRSGSSTNNDTNNIVTSNRSQNSRDTSILETANLMTKSVLLSPTFVSTPTNVISGEVEISSKRNDKEDDPIVSEGLQTNFITEETSCYDPIGNVKHSNLHPNNNDPLKTFYEVNQVELHCALNGVNIDHDISSTSVDKNELQMAVINTISDENLNKINILLDSKLSNRDSDSNTTNNTITDFAKDMENDIHTQNFCSKISIISEETFPLSKLKKSSATKTFTPIEVNSINFTKNSIEPLTIPDLLYSETKIENSNNSTNETNFTQDSEETIAKSSDTYLQEDQDTCITESNELNILENMNIKQSLNDTAYHDWLNNVNTASKENLERNDLSKMNSECLSANYTTEDTNGFNESQSNTSGDQNHIVNVKSAIKNTSKGNNSCNEDSFHSCENNAKANTSLSNENNLNKLEIVKSNPCDESDGYRAPEAEKHVVGERECIKELNMPCIQNSEYKTTPNDNLTNILNVTKELSNKITTTETDKVKEIAAYIKKFSSIYTNREKIQKHLKNENNKKETINSNTNITTSKLWIQGVEKPGGIGLDKDYPGECRVLKTYTRRSPQKQSKPATITVHKSEANNSIDITSVNYELNTDNELKASKQQEFCLCYDFGRLANYDYDNLYEHIHFWQNNSTNCGTDLIFAIYSDEPIVNNYESEVEPKQKTEEKDETHNVCWNVFNSGLCQKDVRYKLEQSELNNKHSNMNVLELSNVTENINNFIDPESHDKNQQMVTNNHNSDLILKTVDHLMVNAVESNNCNIENKIQNDVIMHDDSTLIDAVETGASGNMIKSLDSNLKSTSASEPEFQLSDIIEKVLVENKDSTEKNVSVPEEYTTEKYDESKTKVTKFQDNNILSSIVSRSNEEVNRMLLEAKSSKEENVSFNKKTNNEQANEAENNVIQIPKEEKVLSSMVPKSNDKKRSLAVTNTSESCNNRNNEPSAKKSIKCGICDALLSRVDWREHVKNKHHFIAWKAGSSINLEDPDLLRKLKERLKTFGILSCSICNFESKSFKKFILHIEDCIKQKKKAVEKCKARATATNENVTCGVCQKSVQTAEWTEHIGREHNYLAWSDGKEVLNLEDEDMVWQHLQNIIRANGSLTCYKCGLDRKRVKLYLAHIKTCDGSGNHDDSVMSVDLNSTSNVEEKPDKIVKCGVCQQEVINRKWIEHIAKEHNYLAWQDGAKPLDLEDEDMVWQHLLNIIRTNGNLTCYKCGLERKRVKLYLAHIKTCDGSGHQDDSVMSVDLNSTSKVEEQPDKIVKCGVCEQEVINKKWIEHIAKEHNYLAWQDGAKPLDLEDEDMVWQHLQNIIRTNGGLTCYKCGLDRRRVKLYLAHIKTCDGSGHLDDSVMSVDLNSISNVEEQPDKIVKCGVCKQEVVNRKWIEHIAKEHNYLAWQDGAKPLNLDDEEVVWNHLQQFVRSGGLICHKCGLNRKRVKLYLTHIETCDGTGVSMDDYLSSNMNNDLNSTHNATIIEDADTSRISEPKKNLVVCGVCKEKVSDKDWIEHIGKEHNYLAWQDGETPLDLDDKEVVWQHLQHVIRHNDGITCYKCGLHRKRVKLYLCHIKTCNGGESQGDSTNPPEDLWFEVPPIAKETKVVKCAVCGQEVAIVDWMQHIGKEHSYLAWIDGTTPLDLEDELEVKQHLNTIAKENNGLICSKCDRNIKYSKTYLQHVKECSGATADENDLNESSCTDLFSAVAVKSESVTCGVCETKVSGQHWMEHIQKEHQYLAWIEGQTPLDVNDTTMVQKHLYEISKMLGGLKCIKCGVRRKYVKTYLAHIETCEETAVQVFTELSTSLMDRDELECAICGEVMPPKKWRDHAMDNHYNIAWVVGDVPIELNNPYAAESYLKEYVRNSKKLVCKVCGISRVSYVGFYAHILTCGKTDEETEKFKATCDICNNKYLRIYKSQHMTMHKEKELALERKMLAAQEKEKIKEEELEVSGPRKAAEKAKSVIEKYKDSIKDNKCSKCGFSSEIKKEFLDHACVENEWGEQTDSDESVKIEQYSEGEESEETDIDSNISEEEQAAQLEHEYPSNTKKKHYPLHIIKRLPYNIKNMNNYMKTSTEDFIEEYLSEGGLFPQWVLCELEAVSENDLAKYTPPLTDSCKFRISETGDWQTIKRFESIRAKEATVMFVGASVARVAWAPSGALRQLLAVAAHPAPDAPRLAWDETRAGPGLIQIWDLGNFTIEPQFALGIAHDYGFVWAIDWCPSGVRDEVFSEETNQMHRLGLLAAACSNGSTYIFSVPYPSTIEKKDKIIYRIKPVAELRFTMSTDRKVYQATAVKWSTQKGHSFVVVGYSDGSTAHFDLNGKSPLLRTQEDNITVFYPYYDERVQNSCIEDVDVFPRGRGADADVGVACAGGAGGAGAGALQSHVAAARVLFPPHWPAALLAGDDCLVNQSVNELEWWGPGRRLGGMRGAAGCAWCGRVVSASHPLLRVMRPHPGFTDLYRQIIGAIQITSLGTKRKRQNDELTMIVEPITYSEVVKKYGVDFRQACGKDKATQQKFSSLSRDPYPERFPLADVEAMQFCPTYKHHQKLAIAVHAGIVFIITV